MSSKPLHRKAAALAFALAAAPTILAAAPGARAQSASIASAPANVAPDPAVDYRLSTGDKLRVTVFNQSDLSGEYQVDATNMVSLPLIGRLRAGGLRPVELEKQIADRLNDGLLKDASVSVEVIAFRPFYIVGEVKTPGSYPYVWGMSVLNAVALAGGFTYRAREGSFYLLRTDPAGRKVKLEGDQETAVLPGDVITVRERFF